MLTIQCISSPGRIYLLVSSRYPTRQMSSSLSPSSQKSMHFKGLGKVRVRLLLLKCIRFPHLDGLLSLHPLGREICSGLKAQPPWYPKEESALAIPPRNLSSSKNPTEALTGMLSVLGINPQSKKSLVWFRVRAHTWVSGQVSGCGSERGNQYFSPSLVPSLPFPSLLSKYK